MDSRTLSQNIIWFYIYRTLSRFYMYLPILVIILYTYKLSYIQISCVVAAHGLSIMVFKTPLGLINKKIKAQRFIIFTGELIKCLAILGLALAKGNIYLLIISQTISGIGFALTTSTESNLLLSAMKAANAEGNYRQIEAKSQGYSFLSVLISGIVGSIIAVKNISFPLYFTAPFSILAALSILFFKEPYDCLPVDSIKKKAAEVSKKLDAGSVLHYLVYYAFNRAIILAIFVYVLPFFLLKAFKIDLIFFGAILGIFSLTAYLIANNFEKASSLMPKDSLWVLLPSALLISILLLLIKNRTLLITIPFFLGIAASIVRPLVMGKVNMLIKKNNSVIMSRGEQFFGVLNALFIMIMGYCFNYYSLSITIFILLCIVLTGNLTLLLLFKFKVNFSHSENL